MRLRIGTLLFIGLLALGHARSAEAVLTMRISEGGGTPLEIFDNQAGLDLNDALGIIEVNVNDLNAALLDFAFEVLQVSSNSLTGSAVDGDDATLGVSGSVIRTLTSPTPGAASITIDVSDNGFLFPDPPVIMNSSASDTFNNTAAATQRTFESFFGPNDLLFDTTIPSPVVTNDPAGGQSAISLSGNADATPVTQSIPFSLTNTTVITLGPSRSEAVVSRDRFSGTTTVLVPEPSALALIGLGLPVLALRRLRRKGA